MRHGARDSKGRVLADGMIGRLTKGLICIGAIMAMSPERGGSPDLAAIAGDAGRTLAVQAQAACAADLARCMKALESVGALGSRSGLASQDTLTDADRVAAPRRRGG